jgi:hypothetical protein
MLAFLFWIVVGPVLVIVMCVGWLWLLAAVSKWLLS